MSKIKNKSRQIPFYSEIPQMDYGQIYTVSSIMQDSEMGRDTATFDVTIRDMPGDRNFMVLGGIEDVVNTVLNWRFEKKFVDYLQKEGYVSKNYAKYLRAFKFRGDLWSVPEGTIVFPGEPVIRMTTSLADANLFTAFLATAIAYPTLFLTKTTRVRLAARDKLFCTAGVMRAPGFENALKVQRLSYICGSQAIIPFAKQHFGIKQGKPSIGFYHAVIKSFNTEKEAYRHFFPYIDKFGITTSMVDTYDIKSGIENWIAVEKEARQMGKTLGWVSIDSGDVYKTAVFLRKKLDQAGLRDTKIVGYSNLDEYKIDKLERMGAKIDFYVSITEVLNVADRPVLEAVYKLAETVDSVGKVTYRAKLTPGKVSLPGRKQIFRNYDKKGRITHDVIGLEEEKLGTPLLVQYIKAGQPRQELPTIDELKDYIDAQIHTLPAKLKSLKKANYKVVVSKQVQQILTALRKNR